MARPVFDRNLVTEHPQRVDHDLDFDIGVLGKERMRSLSRLHRGPRSCVRCRRRIHHARSTSAAIALASCLLKAATKAFRPGPNRG